MRVLDVTTSIAGPYCAQILSALGADVIKVERPDTGDDGRAWGPPFWNGEGTMFLSANAGKRSLALSLRDTRGREVLERLAGRSDVFLQSLRPGLAEELGLGADALRARNPRLVYCSVGAYGHTGPLREEPGYDALMQAAGGLISMTGEPDRPGVRVGSSLIDQGTGTWAALGVLAALLERDRTGEGTVVDVSLYETAIGYIGYHLAGYLADGTVPHGEGTRFPMVAPYQVFRTGDGELMIAGGNDRIFAAICNVVGLPELVDDARFRSNPDRVRHRDELCAILERALAEHDTAHWLAALKEAGVPAAPVADAADVAESPQTEALGILQPLRHPAIPDLKLVALPVSFEGERALHRSPPPAVGEHTVEILLEAGYGPDAIRTFSADGVIRGMSHVSASFSATIRVRIADAPGAFGRLASAIGEAGGSLGAIDLVRVEKGTKIRDVTVDASDTDHLERIVERVREVEGVEVERVSDRTFLMHLGGKIEMQSKVPVKTRDDLSMAYTPGVARICRAIHEDRDSAWNLTIKQNTVAVVSDGTAVLGLGDIGPEAAMPVMEGKALLFKEFGGVDAWPLCLDTKDTDEIVAVVKAIAPGFGGINLEDISAPRCFEIEQRLRAELDIPVFHDDQHGTAIVVLAALLNALRVVEKPIEEIKVVLTGVGAAGVAVTDILLNAGVRHVIGCDSGGAIYNGRTG